MHSIIVKCVSFFAFSLVVISCTNQPQAPQVVKKSHPGPNVLFICIDDLNDWVGVLKGHPQAYTPHIDSLAKSGILFTNAHAPAPSCNPSRVAVLTGLKPTTTGIYDNKQPWQKAIPAGVESLPLYFKKYGYKTLGAGKVYHTPYPEVEAWTQYFPSTSKVKPHDPIPDNRPLNGLQNTRNFDWGPIPDEDDDMGDHKVVNWLAGQLQKAHETPFFMAAGIYRPHLPWYVPHKYFQRYPIDSIQLPAVLENDLNDVPDAGVEIALRLDDHKKVTSNNQWKAAVQAYLASIEFADEQVGRILKALRKSEYHDNTIVVLWSDHGWHLGEKSHWRKFALWERSTHVPFIISFPDKISAGTIIDKPVSLLDLYPTLLSYAGLPANSHNEGNDLSLWQDSSSARHYPPVLTTLSPENYSLRTHTYRYIRYADGSQELYDHSSDPHEWYNIADQHQSMLDSLDQFLPSEYAPPAPLAERFSN